MADTRFTKNVKINHDLFRGVDTVDKKDFQAAVKEIERLEALNEQLITENTSLTRNHENQQQTIQEQRDRIEELRGDVAVLRQRNDTQYKDLQAIRKVLPKEYNSCNIHDGLKRLLADFDKAKGSLSDDAKALINRLVSERAAEHKAELEATYKADINRLLTDKVNLNINLSEKEHTIRQQRERIKHFEQKEASIREKLGMDKFGCVINEAERVREQRDIAVGNCVRLVERNVTLNADNAKLHDTNGTLVEESIKLKDAIKTLEQQLITRQRIIEKIAEAVGCSMQVFDTQLVAMVENAVNRTTGFNIPGFYVPASAVETANNRISDLETLLRTEKSNHSIDVAARDKHRAGLIEIGRALGIEWFHYDRKFVPAIEELKAQVSHLTEVLKGKDKKLELQSQEIGKLNRQSSPLEDC